MSRKGIFRLRGKNILYPIIVFLSIRLLLCYSYSSSSSSPLYPFIHHSHPLSLSLSLSPPIPLSPTSVRYTLTTNNPHNELHFLHEGNNHCPPSCTFPYWQTEKDKQKRKSFPLAKIQIVNGGKINLQLGDDMVRCRYHWCSHRIGLRPVHAGF